MNVTKKKILQYLLVAPTKGEGEYEGTSIKAIAEDLDLSSNAIRQYLIELEKEGYVVKTYKKIKKGRPLILYRLHGSAMNFFPKLYVEFSLQLIDELVKQFGQAKVKEILTNVGKKFALEMKQNYPSEEGNSLEERVQYLVKIYEEYGKYPSLFEDETYYYIKNSNCLLYDIVKERPIVCELDHKLVDEILKSKAEKVSCIRDGDPYCLYRVKKTSR
ncbi:MAG: helix-turn-helix transcriptional regulator [Candidatus Hodarchaeales archaeon]